MEVRDKIISGKKRAVYIYLEEANNIVKAELLVIPRQKLREAKRKGFIVDRWLTSDTYNFSKSLLEFIYDRTFEGCLNKVKKHYLGKIKKLEKIRRD